MHVADPICVGNESADCFKAECGLRVVAVKIYVAWCTEEMDTQEECGGYQRMLDVGL